MKVFIAHYHLNPGGVTQIIQSQINGLAQLTNSVELVVICDGQGLQALSLPSNATAIAFPALGYCPNISDERHVRELVSEIKQFFMLHASLADIIHFHNIGLGKNVALTYAMYLLAQKGYAIVNHAHDFPEDRPLNWSYLKTGFKIFGIENVNEILYPSFNNYVFGVLNSHDYSRLHKNGVNNERVFLWPNPVKPLVKNEVLTKAQAKHKLKEALHLDADKLIISYPVRVIRRKNIGEYILLAAILGDKADFLVTLPPKNPVEIEPYEKWLTFCKTQQIKVVFEAGLKVNFEWIMTGSDLCFSTSIMEGFGMVFVEPWLWSTPVAGRELANVMPDLQALGLQYPLLYSQLLVEWNGSWVDFPNLTMKEQMQVILEMQNKQNDSFFKQNPAIMSLFEVSSDSFVTNNKEIIANDLSERKYGEKLYQVYSSLS